MDSPMESTPAPQPQVTFRGKKRKFYRQRPTEVEENRVDKGTKPANEAADATSTARSEAMPMGGPDEEGISVVEVLRRPNARKSRLRGVGFGSDASGTQATTEDDDLSFMIREEQQKALELSTHGMTKRFAAQTGHVGELVNKHMTEYIESELAKRNSAFSSKAPTQKPSSSSSNVANSGVNHEHPLTKKPEGQPKTNPMQGQLMEIDLGDEVRSRNVEMTDRAQRMLRGEAVESEEQTSRPKKIRLGRDGKPWRPRTRRTSDDIRRDELVEAILRENRLGVYDAPTPPPATSSAVNDEDGAADDRIAEEFRKEFMDAMAQRQQKKKPVVPPAKPGAKKEEDILKGPKLGGSRNARAAMRDLLLKQQEGKR